MLVSIYDTKDVFIKEFQVLLASNLLNTKDYDADRQVGLELFSSFTLLSSVQIRNVEILKRRFGETSLNLCEVMIKDIADSKRADQLIHQALGPTPIHPLILSRNFWPQFQNTQFKLPGTLFKYFQRSARITVD